VFVFSGISLFGLGSLLGDVDDWGLLFILIGAVLGIIFWFFIRDKEIHSNILKTIFKSLFIICIIIGLIFAVYGGYGAITQTDIISKRRYDGMAGMLPWIVLIASVIIFALSFLFRYLSKPKTST